MDYQLRKLKMKLLIIQLFNYFSFFKFIYFNKVNKKKIFQMHRVGFEPTKHIASDLKSLPFDHSGTHALILLILMQIFLS